MARTPRRPRLTPDAARPEAVTAYVALGANLGDPVQALGRAVRALHGLPGTRVLACSALYRSAPVDATGPDYINAVAALATRLNAPELLAQLQRLEHDAGRERLWRNAPRTLDLDLLLYGSASIGSPALTVPHPRMLQRAFVLLPLADIDPAWAGAAQAPAIQAQRIARLAGAWAPLAAPA